MVKDKILMITGSTGIAAATAEVAVREEAVVFFTGLAEDSCKELADRLRAEGGRCEYFVGDLSRSDVAVAAVRKCLDRLGRIDALFNVAGISGRRFGDGPIHECSDEGWDCTLANNLRSLFMVTRAVVRRMLEQEPGPEGLRGSVLNMASVLAFSPEPRFFDSHAYAASKGAIVALTRTMAAYYASHGIRVNAIAPGLVRTPMSARAQEDPEILRFMESKQPLARGLIDPAEVARAALFLLGPESRFITGDVLTIDAGWTLSGLTIYD